MAEHRILAIEDDPAIRRGIVDALRFASSAWRIFVRRVSSFATISVAVVVFIPRP